MNIAMHRLCLAAAALMLAGCAGGPAPNPGRAAAANADLGIEYLRDGKETEAIERLEKALEYDSRNVDARWALAIAYSRLNENREADRHYRQAIDVQDRPEIRNSYAVFLCQQGRVEEALSNFEHAADDPRYPEPAAVLTNAGLCLDRAGDRDRAEDYFRRALALDEGHRPTLAALARHRLEGGDALNARGLFQRLEAVTTAQTPLADDWLLLGARIELALGNETVAAAYLQRYNQRNPEEPRTLEDLERGA